VGIMGSEPISTKGLQGAGHRPQRGPAGRGLFKLGRAAPLQAMAGRRAALDRLIRAESAFSASL